MLSHGVSPCEIYVCKRPHDTGESVGQSFVKKSKREMVILEREGAIEINISIL